jgi:hypothetical protein
MTRSQSCCAWLWVVGVVAVGGCSFHGEGLTGSRVTASENVSPAGTPIGESPIAVPPYAVPSDVATTPEEDAGVSLDHDGEAADGGESTDPTAPGDAVGDDGGPPAVAGLARGMILYLRFEQSPEGSFLDDESPLHQVVVPHRLDPMAAWVDGQMGKALLFPGGPDGGYLSVDGWLLNKIGRAVSISCWYLAPAGAVGAGTLVARRWATVNGFLYRLDITGGRLQMSINAGNTYQGRVTSGVDLPQQRWVHLAGTFDGATARIYVDGRESGSAAYGMGIPDEQTPLLVGGSASAKGVSTLLAGQLDEVILYDRALTAEEIASLASGAQPLPR